MIQLVIGEPLLCVTDTKEQADGLSGGAGEL